MPSMFGKDSKKKDLIKNLGNIYRDIEREHQISPGDFPDLREMQEKLLQMDFTKFNTIKKPLLDTVDKMLAEDIARLMSMIPQVCTKIFRSSADLDLIYILILISNEYAHSFQRNKSSARTSLN